MSAPVWFLVAALAASPQATAEPMPPKLIRIIPGDSGVYVDFERRADDVERRVRYCVYMAEEPGGPYEQVARFWAGLYKGTFPNREDREFDPPGESAVGNDWVLVLDDAATASPPPGVPATR